MSLYEEVEQIEKLVNSKIDLEIKELNYIILDINTISSIDKSEYEKLYINSKNRKKDTWFENEWYKGRLC